MMNQIESTISEHWAALKRLALSIIRDPSVADDVLQTAFLKALTTSSPPQSDSKILPWFKAIVRNTALDVARKQKRAAHKVMDTDIDQIAQDEDFNTSACDCVLDLLSRLSKSDRALLTALDIDGASLQDLAAKMGISKNALKVRRHRARQRLKAVVMDICRVGSAEECEACDCG